MGMGSRPHEGEDPLPLSDRLASPFQGDPDLMAHLLHSVRQAAPPHARMRTPVHREIDAWGWYVDRLADLIIAKNRKTITEGEYDHYRALYMFMWSNHGVA